MPQQEIIAEFDFKGKTIVIYKEDDVYHIKHGGVVTQRSVDPNVPIRWLSMILINEEYLRTRQLDIAMKR